MNTFFAQRRAIDTVEADLRIVAGIADTMVSKEINLLIANAQNAATAIAASDGGGVQAVLDEYLNRFKDFKALTVFDAENRIAYAGYVPTPLVRLNGVYLQRALNGDSVISTTRRDDTTGELVMHVCVPVGKDRVLSVTIDGMHFSKLLRDFTIWETGALFIIDGEGKVIANRQDEFVYDQYNLIDMAQYRPEYASVGAAFTNMLAGGGGFTEYELGGQMRLCAYVSVKGSDFGWVLGAAAPLAESPATQVQNGLLVATVFLLLFGVVVAFAASSFLAKPYHVIAEQNTRLVELTESARATSEAKSQFLASMSHEIRTPMNAIIGMGELMRTDNFDETQKNYFSDIRKMARSLLQIINDILDFSKIEAGRLELIPSDYNFITLYDNILSLINFMVEGKNLTLRHSLADDVPHVLFGDEVRVRQVITNLMGNAVKYTREGWVELAISRVHAAGEDYFKIKVSDSGIGIRKEDMPRLFEQFEQMDARRNRDIVGTGLGLSITKRLVDMMGGEISVESEYGKGSAFTILLPIIEGNPDNVSLDSEGPNRAIASPDARVLVVDDNAINLTVAVGFLERHGIYPITAESGQQAIERVLSDKGQYDIVFMDHMMPGMDGVEATRRIRAFEGEYYKSVPIIALSANAVSGARETFLSAGMSDFISKPISAFELNAVLLKWLPPSKLLHRATPGHTSAAARLSDQFDGIIDLLRSVNGLDPDLGLSRVGGNRGVYVNIIRQFIKSAEKDAAALAGFAEAKEWREYVIRAHALKSVFANIGNPSLSGWAFKLEESARALENGVCVSDTPAFCDAVLRFRRDLPIKQITEDETKKQKDAVEKDRLLALFAQLEEACADCDTDMLNDILKTASSFTYNNEVDTLIAEMSELARSFEYEKVALLAGDAKEIIGS
jgi:signal transduction histidine kinase/CheY-like chemotaxis protein/HPt (histidine-containing phosphotransfer) domain-containing protein